MKKVLLLVIVAMVLLQMSCAMKITDGGLLPDKDYPTITVSDTKEFEKVKQAILNTKADKHLDKKRVQMETNGEMSKKVIKETLSKDFVSALIGGSVGRVFSLAGTIVINKAHDTDLSKVLYVGIDYDNPKIKTNTCKFLPVIILAKKFDAPDQLRKGLNKVMTDSTLKLVELDEIQGDFNNKLVFYVIDWKPKYTYWSPIPFVGWDEMARIRTVIELYIDGKLAGRYVMAGSLGSANLMTGLKFAFSSESPYKKIRRWIKSHCIQEQQHIAKE